MKIWRVFHIRDRKYRFEIIVSVCLMIIRLLPSAECATISLECTKVKLLILNNLVLCDQKLGMRIILNKNAKIDHVYNTGKVRGGGRVVGIIL